MKSWHVAAKAISASVWPGRMEARLFSLRNKIGIPPFCVVVAWMAFIEKMSLVRVFFIVGHRLHREKVRTRPPILRQACPRTLPPCARSRVRLILHPSSTPAAAKAQPQKSDVSDQNLVPQATGPERTDQSSLATARPDPSGHFGRQRLLCTCFSRKPSYGWKS